jgi:hypothetical protein
MQPPGADDEHGTANYLTRIKLAQQLLERRTLLTSYQRTLVHTTLEAVDGLTTEMIAPGCEISSADRLLPPSVGRPKATAGLPARHSWLRAPLRLLGRLVLQGLSTAQRPLRAFSGAWPRVDAPRRNRRRAARRPGLRLLPWWLTAPRLAVRWQSWEAGR